MSFPIHLPCEAVLDSIADGVFTVDLDWRITFFNRAAEEITGVPASEALGRNCWEVFHSSLCDGRCALKACIEENRPLSGQPVYIVRPDGLKVPISVSAAPLRNSEGQLLGGVETFRDLTDLTILRREVESQYSLEDIVGRSEAMLRLFDLLPRIAESEASVLLSGESGTGKELFARAIHNLSPRRDKPFVAVNCAALPGELLESELFGYKAGAFTDARKDKPGRFQLAHGGTLFLDEIGDMPAGLQAKLLRVLQDKKVEPLGGLVAQPADARVVAATNKDLDEMVRNGEFRQALFYRLNVVRLRIPPLRERPEDIPLLVRHIIAKLNAIKGKAIAGLSEKAMALLLRHDFPGNIRELENILEYGFILCPGGIIEPAHLPDSLQGSPAGTQPETLFSVPRTMEEIKRLAAQAAVKRHDGKRMPASRELGITKDTLRRLLEPEKSGE